MTETMQTIPREDNVTRSFDKDWLPSWLESLEGLRASEQAIGMWMAYFADGEGMVDDFSWEEISDKAGLAADSIRKIMKRADTGLLNEGLIERHERRIGNAMAMPLFQLNLEEVSAM